jgi:hypothetical protein
MYITKLGADTLNRANLLELSFSNFRTFKTPQNKSEGLNFFILKYGYALCAPG